MEETVSKAGPGHEQIAVTKNPYALAPLDFQDESLRLMQILPGAEIDIIKCELQAHNLREPPEFWALSYTWGTAVRDDCIELNGVRMSCHANLWLFLQQMRLQRQYGPFWIDAICINQYNVHERNQQVQIMGRIYASASGIVVWLGKGNAGTDMAMKKLATRKPLEGNEKNLSHLWTETQARNILSICENPYWRRMWIIQELMLAKRIAVLCGLLDLAWCKLFELLQDLLLVKKCSREVHIPHTMRLLESPAMGIVQAKTTWNNAPLPLSRLLNLYHNHEATNTLDRVYALLGLADKVADIAVDYDKSPKDLFLDVFHHERIRLGSKGAAKVDLRRFARQLEDILRVLFTEDEFELHFKSDPREGGKIVHGCFFHYLRCSFASLSKDDWKKHCLDHFGSAEPPRAVGCSLCEHYHSAADINGDLETKRRFGSGWLAWINKLDHAAKHIRNEYVSASGVRRMAQEDADLDVVEHLWQNRLIDDLDLEELTAETLALV